MHERRRERRRPAVILRLGKEWNLGQLDAFRQIGGPRRAQLLGLRDDDRAAAERRKKKNARQAAGVSR